MIFHDFLKTFDPADFWMNTAYAEKHYVLAPVTEEVVNQVEKTLGYKLPRSYIELMKRQNGGKPRKNRFPMNEPTSWAPDHVAITGIYGIGSEEKKYSLAGKHGSGFWMAEWDYPDIGIYFADCPSAGHDMMCLDYRKNGKDGEPEVVYVSHGQTFTITFVAPTFEAFICGLVDEESIDE